jgi:transitional endoplasmic reticulum ATPase
MKFGEWFRRASDEVPNLASDVARIYEEAMDVDFDVDPGSAYAWNLRGAQRLPWLQSILTNAPEVAEDLLLSGSLLPSATDEVLLELSRNFRSSAAWVFVIHGNVRDYVFDAHQGYGPVPDILGAYWRNTTLFEDAATRGETLILQYSLSGGIEFAGSDQNGPGAAALRGEIERHRNETSRASTDERVFRDLSFLRELLARPDVPAILLYFDRPGLLFPPSGEQIRTGNWVEYVLRWASHIPSRPRHIKVLAADTPEDLHPELRKRVNGIIDVEFHRPANAVERRRFLLACVAACQERAIPMPLTRLRRRNVVLPIDVAEIGHFAEATAGLNYAGIETCLLNIAQQGVVSSDDAMQYIKSERGALLRTESEGLIELIEPTRGLNELVGGLTQIRSRLEMIVQTLSKQDAAAHALAPMGVLFIGPPGTGKSLAASALAYDCMKAGVQYVKLGDFRDMWVGQSERNFSRILKLLESFGKVIVFIDELDQGEGASRGGEMRHETSRRIFGKLLEFMASPRNRGRILWIAASNRPSLIDAALLRPGRFDLILPFAPPDAAGCREILTRHLGRLALPVHVSDAAYEEAAAGMAVSGFTGAEIELVATETARRVFAADGKAIRAEDLREVLADYDPETKKTTDYQLMLRECESFVAFRSLREAN